MLAAAATAAAAAVVDTVRRVGGGVDTKVHDPVEVVDKASSGLS